MPERPGAGLNVVRLALAAMVLVSHAFAAYGLAEPTVAGRTLGTYAVLGFFAVSGYLITLSRARLPLGTFLRHRAGRILPAYWVCLVVTAGIAVAGSGARPGDTVAYVLRNGALVQVQGDIGGTPTGVPYAGTWNASLWTLPHEFTAYVVVGVLGGAVALLRAPGRVLLLGAWAGSTGAQVLATHLPGTPDLLRQLLLVLPCFLGGAVVASWRPALPGSPFLAAAAGVAWGAVLLLPLPGTVGWSAPALAVALVSLGRALPAGPAARHDLSYGLYLYAFPVSQVVVARWADVAFGPYLVAVTALATGAAAGSWVLVERPAQAWARRRSPRAAPAPPGPPRPARGRRRPRGSSAHRGARRSTR